jgi:tetratricopeptide (TPR) repeat protein
MASLVHALKRSRGDAHRRAVRRFRRLALALVATAQFSPACLAADRNADFTAALRERGWDDTATAYLQWVEKSPLVTDSFRQELPYQRGLSLAAQGRKTRSAVERERLYDEAAAAFTAFAKADSSDAAMDALRQAATLYAEQALTTLAAPHRLPPQASAQRDQANQRARGQFERAVAAAADLVARCTAELSSLPAPAEIQSNPEAKARRDLLRTRQVESRFLVARLKFEEAATFDPKSKEFSAALDEASQLFGALVEEYRDSPVGASSRFYQGRCAQEVGAYEKALGCYEDLIRLPTADAEFRRWTARAQRRRTECLVALGKIGDAIQGAEEWLTGSRPAEREQPEWLEVAYALSRAYEASARSVDGKNDPKDVQAKMRSLLRDVAQHPNENQQDAKLALASLGGRATSTAELKSFADASAAGKTSLDLWNSSMLAARLARQNNPEAVDELEQQAADHRADALQALRVALDLADRQTPTDQLNAVRYYLCVLYWEDKQIYDAAVLGKFLATRYPESDFAATAAQVGLAAFEQIAIESRTAGNDAVLATKNMAELAELIATRWPDTKEGASAVNVLIQTALREGRLGDAEALLARLPAESRGAAQLSLGAGLWSQYIRAAAGAPGEPSEELVALREKAGALLAEGFASAAKTTSPTTPTAVGALYLAQYQLAKGDAAAAIDTLEDKTVGPLTLVQSQAEAAAKPEFIQETYKAALRAYLSAEPPQREKADRIMAAMEEHVAQQSGESAAQKLTDLYLGLGVQLQQQLKELTAVGQNDKAQQVAAAFGDLLERVSKRPDADGWRIRSWLAQTNLQIGQSLAPSNAKPYLARAKAAYEGILKDAAKDPKYLPDANTLLAIRIRFGECLAAEGQFQEALDQYAAILREKPSALDLQKTAAATLQQWGAAKRDASVLDQAIRGAMPQKDGKNLVWGWLRLARLADAAKRQAAKAQGFEAQTRAARFEELFFESRYNVAQCRYLAGTVGPASTRQDQLQSARANIEQMRTLYPDLGGPKWKKAFTELLQKIDAELGKK